MENTTKPLDVTFNVAVNVMAFTLLPVGWDTVKRYEDAPSNLRQLKAHVAETGRILVPTQDGMNTIFRDDEINGAFRAWHDAVHVVHGFEFTESGEAATCLVQMAQLFKKFGVNATSKKYAQYLMAEVIGMSRHSSKTGRFPEDMYAFTEAAYPAFEATVDHLAYLLRDEQSAKHVAFMLYGNPYDPEEGLT
jgi:hypothetical protein